MKRTILTGVLSVLLSMVVLKAQDIPNPGFEQWQDYTLFEEPEGYFTTNSQAYFLGGSPHVIKAEGRNPGTSAIRLQVDESAFFGITPLTFILDLSNPLAGGIPFGGRPDSLVGHFNYRLSPEDTFTLVAVFKFQGLPIGFSQIDLAGTSNGYERISIPTEPFVFPPDSVGFLMGIAVASGTPAIGDFVEVDDLTFINSSAQLPNNDFENWELVSFREPVGWSSTNLFAAIGRMGGESVSRTTDAYEGDFAARIESIEYEFFGFRDTSGILITGDVASGQEGFAYSGDHNELNFYYKYLPTGVPNEMAFVNVAMYKEGNELGSFFQSLSPSANYTRGSIAIPPLSETPDTCFIGFAVGVTDTIEENFALGSVLYVDGLSFDFGVNTKDIPHIVPADLVYPNPATDILWIKEESIKGEILRTDVVSLDGKWVRSIQNNSNGVFIGDLSDGWYTVRVVTTDAYYLAKFEKL